MKKGLKFIGLGILFGIILIKSEAVSWFRIFEMFHFQSFHMYGIIGSAVFLGAITVLLMKKLHMKDFYGDKIEWKSKDKLFKANLLGGICFGLGWALAGACPGPMFALLGYGVFGILVVLLGAIFGTFVYGKFKAKLPH